MTAIQEVLESYTNKDCYDLLRWIGTNKQRLVEKEKQQIIDAYKSGVDGTMLAEDYYNKTYKNK